MALGAGPQAETIRTLSSAAAPNDSPTESPRDSLPHRPSFSAQDAHGHLCAIHRKSIHNPRSSTQRTPRSGTARPKTSEEREITDTVGTEPGTGPPLPRGKATIDANRWNRQRRSAARARRIAPSAAPAGRATLADTNTQTAEPGIERSFGDETGSAHACAQGREAPEHQSQTHARRPMSAIGTKTEPSKP